MLWLFALPLALGAFPGTVVLRRLRLPAWCWLPLTLSSALTIGYVWFWYWLFWPGLARPQSPFVVMASALAFAALVGSSAETRRLLRQRDVWLPLVLMLTLAAAYLAYLAMPGVEVWARFTVPMPPEDNVTPRVMADRFYFQLFDTRDPGPITRFLLETRSSDRPPLQAALILILRRIHGRLDPQWAYQVTATLLQMSWLPALFALARALELNRRQLVFVLVGAAMSGFFVLHSVYTWPKLLAGSLVIYALAVMFLMLRDPAARRTSVAALCGAFCALALLAHGGSFFPLLALPVLFASTGAWRFVTLRQAAAAAVVAILLLAPWLAYQRYYDPPGNVLMKIHFAGVWPPDNRGTLTAIRDAYAGLAPATFVANRFANLQEQWFVFGKTGASHFTDWMQWQQFFHHIPTLAGLALGLAALVIRGWRRAAVAALGPAAVPLRHLGIYLACTFAGWLLLIFEPHTAFIHHGSLAATMLLFFCAAAWTAALPRTIGYGVMALHGVLFVTVWCTSRTLPTAPAPRAWDPLIGLTLIAAVAGFAGALYWLPASRAGSVPEDDDRPHPLDAEAFGVPRQPQFAGRGHVAE